MSDEKILTVARELVAGVRASELKHDEYQAAFNIAKELLYLEWYARETTALRTLGETKEQS